MFVKHIMLPLNHTNEAENVGQWCNFDINV